MRRRQCWALIFRAVSRRRAEYASGLWYKTRSELAKKIIDVLWQKPLGKPALEERMVLCHESDAAFTRPLPAKHRNEPGSNHRLHDTTNLAYRGLEVRLSGET